MIASKSPNADAAFNNLVPDGCSAGIALRSLLVFNLTALVVALAGGWRWNVSQLTLAAIWLEPIALTTLVLWCLTRRLSLAWAPWLQASVAIAIPVLCAGCFWWLLDLSIGLLNVFNSGYLIAVVVGSAALVYVLALRQKALSPALGTARLQALQARIRPHFLFNSLNAALAVIRMDPKRAEGLLEDLADLFRALLQEPRQTAPLAQELALCRQYVAIEQVRLGERLVVNWQVNNAPLQTLIPPLLLQPLIENAVVHGIERITHGGTIDVQIDRNRGSLNIVVSNPLPEQNRQIDATQPGSGHHMALKNISERLRLLYDVSAQMQVTAEEKRFNVHITLPLTAPG